ncbi:MAG: substrate-binding domain-containing protein [Planctomycetota bacterium]|jgi:DNA-binding LacI/PurR family transcriptional regulator|nr:substrate-binding domain-containing protein [Planctomycetota bacterium]
MEPLVKCPVNAYELGSMPAPSSRTDAVVSTIRKLIADHADDPSWTLPSERSLAAELAVGRVTVRRALARLTTEGLLDIRQGARSRLRARAASGPLTGSVVLIHRTLLAHLSRPVPKGYASWLRPELQSRFHAAGLPCELRHLDDLADDGIANLCDQRPGLIVLTYDISTTPQGTELAEAAAAHGIAVIAVAESPTLGCAYTFSHDHHSGAEAITTALIERGCRRILPLWRFPHPTPWLQARETGYQTAMHAAGLKALTPVRTRALPADNSGDRALFDEAVRGIAAMLPEHLCCDRPVDAIMLATDAHAAQLAAALRLFGRDPNEDIIIAGYDDTWTWQRARMFEPQGPLLTVDRCEATVADAVVRLAQARLDHGPPAEPQHTVMPGKVVTVNPRHFTVPRKDPWGELDNHVATTPAQ